MRRKRRSGPKRCYACGEPIRFLRMRSGRWLPVELKPSELRGDIIVRRGKGKQLSHLEAAEARRMGFDLYVSHFKACPASREQHRERALGKRSRESARARQQAKAAFARAAPDRQPALFEDRLR